MHFPLIVKTMTSHSDSPPSEIVQKSPKYHRRYGMRKWVMVLMGCILIVAILPLFVGRKRSSSGDGEHVNNLRQIGLALFEFETEYGRFPDETTIDAVRTNTGSDLSLGTKTSNDFFRQLIASGIAQNETMFYAKIKGCRKPDNKMDGIHALEKGEVGFTWFKGATLKDNPSRPLVVAPMIMGTDRFDPKPFRGKAFIVKMDNSVGSLPIDKDGHALLYGKNIMDPHHVIWDCHAPIIAWPDL
jgi:hypothetical protein